MKKSTETTPSTELYYDSGSGDYWLKVPSGFLRLGSGPARRHLRRGGLSQDNFGKDGLNEVERALTIAELERACDYCGQLAGHRPGFFTAPGGKRVLVTSAPSLPAAKSGTCQAFQTFSETLLGAEQTERLLCWLKVTRGAMLAGRLDFGQMLVFAGPGGCGKSLMQAALTLFMGGRAEKPYQFMVGETNFNAELACAEHWIIEDESARTDIRSRLKFSQEIKAATATREMKIHGKGRQGITLPTFRRLTLSCNDETERFMIVPPMEADLADKVMLFKCSQADYGGDSDQWLARFSAELPALYAELDAFRIPKRLREPRFGVKAFHHPELLAKLVECSPQTRLLSLIDQTVFARSGAEWSGSADELQTRLYASELAPSARSLLETFSGACGTYLGRLKASGRVSRIERNGVNVWTILPPQLRP